MKKKNIKILTILVFAIFIIFSFYNNSLCAFSTGDWKPGAMTGGNDIKNIGNTIIGALQIIGSLVSIIALIIIGIKYMMGSIEEKAEYKKTLIPYLIGAIMVFGISNILAIVVNIAGVFN